MDCIYRTKRLSSKKNADVTDECNLLDHVPRPSMIQKTAVHICIFVVLIQIYTLVRGFLFRKVLTPNLG